MYAIIGLGNPENKYLKTLHNMGFLVIDKILEKKGLELNKTNFDSKYCLTQFGDEKVIIAQPQTYMNNSGVAVQKIMNFYKIPSDHIIIVYDDLDLNIGTIRIKPNGQSGTHNGMRSIVQMIGTTSFPRIRIGTKPEKGYHDIVDYVLSDIKKEDEETFKKVFDKASDAAIKIVGCNNFEEIMTKFNGKC